MSKSTKSRLTSDQFYTTDISDNIEATVTQPITLRPDGTTLVKLKTEEVLKQCALMVGAIQLLNHRMESENRTHADEHSIVPTRPKETKPGRRLGSRLRGPKTETMKEQLTKFSEFVKKEKDDPLADFHFEENINSMAGRFWKDHRRTFERAAKAKGERKGYSCPKALATAYRNAHRAY